MPRRLQRVLKTVTKRVPAGVSPAEAILARAKPDLPRLWNAKRRIKSGRILALRGDRYLKGRELDILHHDNASQGWKQLVSEDVVKFIEDAKLPLSERRKCVANPNDYFAYPDNVPTALRKQIYFPDFTITLKRTPNLPPRYAAFDVPLWFNKLDMKDYLRSVYGVDVLHVRSAVFQAQVKRRDTKSKYTNGQLYRPSSKKKMTVELVEPFVWPEPEEDTSPWETDTYYKGQQSALDTNRQREETAKSAPNKPRQKSIAQQAKELLAGQTVWKPTWESMPTDSRILKPFDPTKLRGVVNERTAGRSASVPR